MGIYLDAVDLLSNGATWAKQFKITPGIALSANQMAALTQDMVWLETQVVNGQAVLVPVVYLSSVKQDAEHSGQALIRSEKIDLHTGTLSNSGVIQSSLSTVITADNISNLNGKITSLGDIKLASTGDLLNRAGLIQAGNNLVMVADKDLTLQAGQVSAA